VTYYIVFFAAGFAGSFHCIACAADLPVRWPRRTRFGGNRLRHVLYNTAV